jgi:hypothetical protein
MVKSSEELAEKQEEHQEKVRKTKGQPKMQEKHQWWDTVKKDGTHQRQHLIMSTSYERSDPNNDNPDALRYSLGTHSMDYAINLVCSRGARST